jgi:ubiquinone/menaquinone biosynthesis C-methylase UbiE
MVKMDITDIQYPDNSFDVVFASHVLEHIPDDVQAMRELCRVLRPDGWAVLQVPMWGPRTKEDPTVTDPAERAKLFGQDDHVRMYGHDGEYERRLRRAGFDVTVERVTVELGAELTRRYRLLDNEDVYLCRKSDGSRTDEAAATASGEG